MAAECKCPNCGKDLSEDAKARCGEQSMGTALVAELAISAPPSVAVFCPVCKIWIECDCDSTEGEVGAGGQ